MPVGMVWIATLAEERFKTMKVSLSRYIHKSEAFLFFCVSSTKINLALNHAFCCDRVAVLDKGKLVTFGPPDAVLVSDVIEPVFQVTLHQTFAKQLPHPVLTFAKPRFSS